MYQRTRTFPALLLLLSLSLLAAGCTSHTPGPKQALETPSGNGEAKNIVVATVNEAPITMDAVVRMMNRMKVPNHGELPDNYLNEVRSAAVQRLVLQELAYQKAKKSGVTVDQKDIDEIIASFREKMGGEKGAAEFLAKEGLAQVDLNAQVRRSLMLEKIYAREVAAKAVVSEEDLKREYDKEKMNLILPEKVKVTDIVVFSKDDENKAQQKARDLRTRVTGDKDQDPWKLVLDGAFLVRNMDLRAGQEKNRQLYLAAKAMKPGEVSDVIKNDEGYHVIKLTEWSPEKQLTLEEAKPTLEVRLKGAAQQKRLDAWSEELRKDAKIEIRDSALIGGGAVHATGTAN
jgi:parvulin-like peptidyl-prolyl isomerase